jgi:hypothetical protein
MYIRLIISSYVADFTLFFSKIFTFEEFGFLEYWLKERVVGNIKWFIVRLVSLKHMEFNSIFAILFSQMSDVIVDIWLKRAAEDL